MFSSALAKPFDGLTIHFLCFQILNLFCASHKEESIKYKTAKPKIKIIKNKPKRQVIFCKEKCVSKAT